MVRAHSNCIAAAINPASPTSTDPMKLNITFYPVGAPLESPPPTGNEQQQ